MIPKNHEYIRMLKSSLEHAGVKVQILKPFHYSTFTNIVKMVFFRIKGYKIIHVHWLYIFPFALIMKIFYLFCSCLGIKIVWEMHNIVPHKYDQSDIDNYSWFYEKSTAVIYHSSSDVERADEYLKTRSKKKHIVIPHGNFNESYDNRISKKDARRILNIPDNKKVILCFGFIRKNRGYEYLVEATKNMHDSVVIVAGKIMHKDVYENIIEYEKKIPNLKVVAKWIPDNEIQVYFNACDIVVVPYTEITTSGVIPLAYAFSRPVITSKIGGMNDIVNERTGILVPPKDSHMLRLAIERIFSMDIESLGRSAHEFARKELNWESNAQKIKELYETILS